MATDESPDSGPAGREPARGSGGVTWLSSRAVGITGGLLGVLLGLLALTWMTPHEPTREEYLALDYFAFEPPKPLRPFELVTHTGETFDRDSLKGHWNLLFFGYTYCPDVCPTTLALLNSVVTQLAADDNPVEPRVYLISVDPDRDTAEQLAAYVPFFNTAFTGVTGKHAQIAGFAQQLYVPFGKVPGGLEGSYLVDHGANIIVIDPAAQYAGFFRAPHHTEQIVKALTALLRG